MTTSVLDALERAATCGYGRHKWVYTTVPNQFNWWRTIEGGWCRRCGKRQISRFIRWDGKHVPGAYLSLRRLGRMARGELL